MIGVLNRINKRISGKKKKKSFLTETITKFLCTLNITAKAVRPFSLSLTLKIKHTNESTEAHTQKYYLPLRMIASELFSLLFLILLIAIRRLLQRENVLLIHWFVNRSKIGSFHSTIMSVSSVEQRWTLTTRLMINHSNHHTQNYIDTLKYGILLPIFFPPLLLFLVVTYHFHSQKLRFIIRKRWNYVIHHMAKNENLLKIINKIWIWLLKCYECPQRNMKEISSASIDLW